MNENEKLDLMKKFKELNVAEYTTKYGDYYGLMFAGAEIATKELQKENVELKKEWQEQVQKATDEGYARTLQTIQLNNAKELLEELYDCIPASSADYYKETLQKVADFLNSEVEK